MEAWGEKIGVSNESRRFDNGGGGDVSAIPKSGWSNSSGEEESKMDLLTVPNPCPIISARGFAAGVACALITPENAGK